MEVTSHKQITVIEWTVYTKRGQVLEATCIVRFFKTKQKWRMLNKQLCEITFSFVTWMTNPHGNISPSSAATVFTRQRKMSRVCFHLSLLGLLSVRMFRVGWAKANFGHNRCFTLFPVNFCCSVVKHTTKCILSLFMVFYIIVNQFLIAWWLFFLLGVHLSWGQLRTPAKQAQNCTFTEGSEILFFSLLVNPLSNLTMIEEAHTQTHTHSLTLSVITSKFLFNPHIEIQAIVENTLDTDLVCPSSG